MIGPTVGTVIIRYTYKRLRSHPSETLTQNQGKDAVLSSVLPSCNEDTYNHYSTFLARMPTDILSGFTNTLVWSSDSVREVLRHILTCVTVGYRLTVSLHLLCRSKVGIEVAHVFVCRLGLSVVRRCGDVCRFDISHPSIKVLNLCSVKYNHINELMMTSSNRNVCVYFFHGLPCDGYAEHREQKCLRRRLNCHAVDYHSASAWKDQ